MQSSFVDWGLRRRCSRVFLPLHGAADPMRSTFREMTTLVIATVITAACAKAPPRTAAERQSACPLTQDDSAFLSRGPVYRECAVDTKAKLITSTAHTSFTPPRAG